MSLTINRPCVTCGIPTPKTYCPRHTTPRNVAAPQRLAYGMPEYRKARAEAFDRAGGRCEYRFPNGARCTDEPTEANHIVPLASARSVTDLIALNQASNVEAVCELHNP